MNRTFVRAAVLISLVVPNVSCLSRNYNSHAASHAQQAQRVAVLAHRGASGYRPEHTLEGYRLAVEMGADFIEPDVVSTKDGKLIVRHENNIIDTTDVAEKFPARKTTKEIDGVKMEGFFTEDFTLAELKQLRAKQRVKSRPQEYNGKFAIPTLEEVLALSKELSNTSGRVIGVYPEIKHPTYFKKIGLPLEAKILSALNSYGFKSASDPVFIQSFEPTSLKEIRAKSTIRTTQLLARPEERPYDVVAANGTLTFGAMLTPQGLKDLTSYATVICPHKWYVSRFENGKFVDVMPVVSAAKQAGLEVHLWGFSNEDSPVPNPSDEILHYYKKDVTGIFSDNTDAAYRAREEFLKTGSNP